CLPMCSYCPLLSLFFFNAPSTPPTYTLSLHDALPIYRSTGALVDGPRARKTRCPRSRPSVTIGWDRVGSRSRTRFTAAIMQRLRSEEHTSELQSQSNLVCRLLLEKKKKKKKKKNRKIK